MELLAIVWALQKCRILLLGLPDFQIVTDHKPLLPILNNYTLDAIENTRIQRLKEKTGLYAFKAVWRSGKDHVIPDALSRAPVEDPTPEDETEVQQIQYHAHVRTLTAVREVYADNSNDTGSADNMQDMHLARLKGIAQEDNQYQLLGQAVSDGFPASKEKLNSQLLPFWKVRHELSVDDGLVLKGAQLVVPQAARPDTLARLHDSHQGIERTKRRARQTVWWPGITSDIINTVSSCNKCQERLPSLQREPLMTDPPPTRVFEDVSADLFSYAGRSYLVYVDRLSGWPALHLFPRDDTTSRQVIRALRENFVTLSVPVRLRTDGGPQFASHDFRAFMKRWGVCHVMSTPHYPASNGLSEAAVKSVKSLVAKTTVGGNLDDESFDRGLLELRNAPRADGRSPAQIVFGHPLRSCVPAHRRSFAKEWQTSEEICDKRAAEQRAQIEEQYNKSAKSLTPVKIGTSVRLQGPVTGRWDKVGVVVGVGRHRDYHVKLPSGRVLWRNRRYLRPTTELMPHSLPRNAPPLPPTRRVTFLPPEDEAPRRSSRERKSPDRLSYG